MTVVCRWIDVADGAELHEADGCSGRIQQYGVAWKAYYDGVECGRAISKVGAQIIVANVRGRKLMPNRVMASEHLKEVINRRLKVGRI